MGFLGETGSREGKSQLEGGCAERVLRYPELGDSETVMGIEDLQ